jgi:predicted enzyme related to lactoylglutathione lyase
MAQQTKINYIEFQADNLSKIKEFYSRAFGWTFTDYASDYVAFNDEQLDDGFTTGKPVRSTCPLVILYS